MALREVLFQRLQEQRFETATSNLLTTVWASLSAPQRDTLVRLILRNPEKAGEALRTALVSAITDDINAELDALLVQANIDRTYLEGLF